MSQKWFQKANTQAAVIGGIFLLVATILTGIFGHFKAKKQFDKDKAISNLEFIDISRYSLPYGFSTICFLDIKLRNSGSMTSYIKRFGIEVLNKYIFRYDPCPKFLRFPETAEYNINLAKLDEGELKNFNLSHIVKSGESERIVFKFGGNREDGSYLYRIKVTIYADKDVELISEPIDILVFNNDKGQEMKLGEDKKYDSINMKALPILTKAEIKESLIHPPSMSGIISIKIPSWFD